MSECEMDGDDEHQEDVTDLSLPQKRHYRQRAHSNPIADHCMDYPPTPDDIDWSLFYPIYDETKAVEFVDIGCGYGGLLVQLSPLFPDVLMLGIEIRVKVSDYVKDRVKALRSQNPGQYNNINCIRSNAMKYFPNFFRKAQLSKIFFLFPDPHFKKQKHKWRIVSPQLLSEYAYFLRVGGLAYVATDVQDLYEWMCGHLNDHPLFVQLPDEEVQSDPVVKKFPLTEEGTKVRRNNGSIFTAVFRRIEDPLLLEKSSES